MTPDDLFWNNPQRYCAQMHLLEEKAIGGETLSYDQQQDLYDFMEFGYETEQLNQDKWDTIKRLLPDMRFKELSEKFYSQDCNVSVTEDENRELDTLVSDWNETLKQAITCKNIFRCLRKEVVGLLLFDSNPLTQREIKAALILSRNAYIQARRGFEGSESNRWQVSLNNTELTIDEETVVHILMHYFTSELKPKEYVNPHHRAIIPYCEVMDTLKGIIQEIDNSQLYALQDIKNIYFKYKRVDYVVHTKENSKGNLMSRRITAFFPLTRQGLRDDLALHYTLKDISKDLGVYTKNTN